MYLRQVYTKDKPLDYNYKNNALRWTMQTAELIMNYNLQHMQ